jgi:prepilin-type N-terminal cleavage/methylation domain-containing protein
MRVSIKGDLKMKRQKGFTLIELMVVVMIVAILAAVAIPLMRGRVEAAKWSEGKAMAGTISTCIRAYAAEQGTTGTYGDQTSLTPAMLGFQSGDLTGTWFTTSNFSWTVSYDTAQSPPLQYTITVTPGTGFTGTTNVTLDQSGNWTGP